jgi:SAM-dependent methyltransferase
MDQLRREVKAAAWRRGGRKPETSGYNTARWLSIESDITNAKSSGRYGYDSAGLDERVVEYPWLFDRMTALHRPNDRVLDAGSVLNHKRILDRWRAVGLVPLSVVTLKYEGVAHPSDDVRYEFADLRALPYRDEWFAQAICVSTIEHVGLDNTIYGAAAERTDPTQETARALRELHRVTQHGGTLLLSVPFGARSNRGWFRIFDIDDLKVFTNAPGWSNARLRIFQSTADGWRESSANDARTAGYNEPKSRGGQQTGASWVHGAEAVALLELARD